MKNAKLSYNKRQKICQIFLVITKSVVIFHEFSTNTYTVKSPNIARPLTLRTSPSDYATLNQIKPFLISSIRLLMEREKQQNILTLSFRC